jgi:multidrug efflux pump subunit AcrA (membrane-fusion protein)
MNHKAFAFAVLFTVLAALPAGCGSAASKAAVPTALPVVQDLSGITAEGRLEPIRFVSIASNADGLVSEVMSTEGAQVEAGQILARLDSSQTRTLESAQASTSVELSAAYQAARVAQSRLDAYPIPRIFVDLTPEKAAQEWLAELDAARSAFEPYKETSRKTLKPNHIFPHLPRRVWFDTGEYRGMAKEYEKRLNIAWVNYRKAVAWLALDSDFVAAQARLSKAQQSVGALQDASLSSSTAGERAALANAEIRAPFAGTITNLDLKEGQRVSAGIPVVTIGDLSKWAIKTTDLSEIDVVNIEPGQPVTVTLDALPGAVLKGSVQSVDQNYSEREGDVVYSATIVLEDTRPVMRWGMTAHVNFGK